MAGNDDIAGGVRTGIETATHIGAVAGSFAINPLLGVLHLLGLMFDAGLKGGATRRKVTSDLERNRTIAANNLAKMESEKTKVGTTATSAREREEEAASELALELQRRAASGVSGASFLNLQQARIETLATNLAEIDRAETEALGDVDLGKDPDWDKFSALTNIDIKEQGQKAAYQSYTETLLPEAGDMVGDWLGKIKTKKHIGLTPKTSYASTMSKNKRLYGSLMGN